MYDNGPSSPCGLGPPPLALSLLLLMLAPISVCVVSRVLAAAAVVTALALALGALLICARSHGGPASEIILQQLSAKGREDSC